MFDCPDLVGLDYVPGRQDCFSLVRRFYRRFGVEIPNLARPTEFWTDPSLDLYALYPRFGFRPVFDQPVEPGDAVLMQIRSAINSHAAICLGDNRILHHLPEQLSRIDLLRPRWINRVTVHLRHPDVHEQLRPETRTVHLHEVLDAPALQQPDVQDALADLLRPGS